MMDSISPVKENKRLITILLCLIILLAGGIRLYSLSTPSISSDGVSSLNKSKRISARYIVWEATHKCRPMLYFTFLHYWGLIAGSSEFLLRLPTALFGILSVFVIFKLASILFDDRTALIGALLLAVNPEHFFCSFLLKQYTLIALLSLTALYLLIRALKERRVILWVAFGLCNVAMLYTHKSAVFVVLTEVCYMAVVCRKYRYSRQVFTFIGILFVLLVALFFLQGRHSQIFSDARWMAMPTFGTFLKIISLFMMGFYITAPKIGYAFADKMDQVLQIEAMLLPVKIFIVIFFSALFIFGIYKYFWADRQRASSPATDNYKPLVYLWAAVPILAAYAISFLLWPSFGPTRYHLFWSCAIILLLAKGIASVGKLRFIVPILFIAVGVHVFPIATAESDPRSLNWKVVSNYLKENVSEGEKVHFLSGRFVALPLRYYYEGYINTDIKKIKPNVQDGLATGVYLVEATRSVIPKKYKLNADILDVFYTRKEVINFYYIKVTHYWKPKWKVPDFGRGFSQD